MGRTVDPAEILQSIYAAGFELQTFDLFPKAIGISRGDCLALVETSESGLKIIGSPGWKVGGFLGVLTTKAGERVFQYKSEFVSATPERVGEVETFKTDLELLLRGGAM